MQGDKMNFDFLLDNIFFANIDGPEVQKGKVNVKLEVKKTPRAYELNFQTEGIVWIPCDRCLDEMEQPVTSTDKIMVKFGREYGEDGDIIVVPEEDGDVNVAWFIYEFVALSVPMKHVHPPGKCNKTVTGKLSKHLRTNADDEDSNDFDTGGGDDDIIVDDDNDNAPTDPRWNELKKIIDNN